MYESVWFEVFREQQLSNIPVSNPSRQSYCQTSKSYTIYSGTTKESKLLLLEAIPRLKYTPQSFYQSTIVLG